MAIKMSNNKCVLNDLIYTNEDVARQCIESNFFIFEKIDPQNIFFIEPSAGNGSFFKQLTTENKIAYEINPTEEFEGLVKADFFEIEEVYSAGRYKFFLGFPPIGKSIGSDDFSFLDKTFELGADFVSYILPVSFANKKSIEYYAKKGYTFIKKEVIPADSFTLANGSKYRITTILVTLIKTTLYEKFKFNIEKKLTYGDIFKVYTINTSLIKVKEDKRPRLFRNNRIPRNKRTGLEYQIRADTDGFKYYWQDGINKHRIKECEIFLPLRVFRSNKEGLKLYDEFDEVAFGKIGFGLKLRKGYVLKYDEKKYIYYIYRNVYMGVLKPVAKIDLETVKGFYMLSRYNWTVYISSKKLILANKKGIL